MFLRKLQQVSAKPRSFKEMQRQVLAFNHMQTMMQYHAMAQTSYATKRDSPVYTMQTARNSNMRLLPM